MADIRTPNPTSGPAAPHTPAPARLSLTVPAAASPPASQCTTPGTATDATTAAESDYDPASPHPLSAFYSHPATRTSLEQLRNASSVTVAHHRPSPSRSATATTRASLGQAPGSRDGGGACGGCTSVGPGFARPGGDLEAGPPAAPAGACLKGGACLVVVEAGSPGSAGSSSLGLAKPGEAWPCRDTMRRRRLECQRQRRHRPFNRLSPRMRLLVKALLALLVVGIATGLGVGISKALGVGVWRTENSQTAIGN